MSRKMSLTGRRGERPTTYAQRDFDRTGTASERQLKGLGRFSTSDGVPDVGDDDRAEDLVVSERLLVAAKERKVSDARRSRGAGWGAYTTLNESSVGPSVVLTTAVSP